MNLNEAKSFLGEYVREVNIAKSYVNRNEILREIIETIIADSVDVDEDYLNLINNIDYKSLKINVAYVPVYIATSVARLSWKEKENSSENNSDHQEFVRFVTAFYNDENNIKNRINNLDVLKIIDKKNNKIFEQKVENSSNVNSNSTSLVARDQVCLLPSPVLDVPYEENQLYPFVTSYIMSKKDIEKKVEEAFHQTKSYKKFVKRDEKWVNIDKIDLEVILVPIAKVKLGEHYQYINCANSVIDVQYERNKEITKNLTNARLISIPSIIAFICLSVASFFFKMRKEMIFENGIKYLFGNYADIIWLVLVILGLIFSLCALPTRNGIVKRVAKKKQDHIKTCKIFSRLLIDVGISLLILLLMCL